MNFDKLTRDYRCARCWGALVLKHLEGEWRVVCAADWTHPGYVTAAWVDHRRKLDNLEASEVGSRFAEILSLKRPDLKAASRALYGDDGEGG